MDNEKQENSKKEWSFLGGLQELSSPWSKPKEKKSFLDVLPFDQIQKKPETVTPEKDEWIVKRCSDDSEKANSGNGVNSGPLTAPEKTATDKTPKTDKTPMLKLKKKISKSANIANIKVNKDLLPQDKNINQTHGDPNLTDHVPPVDDGIARTLFVGKQGADDDKKEPVKTDTGIETTRRDSIEIVAVKNEDDTLAGKSPSSSSFGKYFLAFASLGGAILVLVGLYVAINYAIKKFRSMRKLNVPGVDEKNL